MDWATRTALSWRLSNTQDSDFCVEALQEALAKYGSPEVFNTDQGCQFTSEDFTSVLIQAGVQISMDGKGRWMDNVFIERLWRSLKYECVYLHAFQDGLQARQAIGTWLRYYNEERPHSIHAGPDTHGGVLPPSKGSLTTLMESTLTPLPACPKDGVHLIPQRVAEALTRCRG